MAGEEKKIFSYQMLFSVKIGIIINIKIYTRERGEWKRARLRQSQETN